MNLGMLVSGIVIDNGVDQLAGRHFALNSVQEADELLVAVALHAASDDTAIQCVEGGEQRGGAMPFVVVCHGAAATLLHWQSRLATVERLDLALLIDRQHDGVGWWIDIEPDDVVQFAGKARVVGQLEMPRSVRLQTMLAPDALHRTDADSTLR